MQYCASAVWTAPKALAERAWLVLVLVAHAAGELLQGEYHVVVDGSLAGEKRA